MSEEKQPFKPTRTCPHRWCRALHLAPMPFCLMVVAFDLWHNWTYLFILVTGVMATIIMTKVVHFKPRPRSTPRTAKDVMEDLRDSPMPIDLEIQDAKYGGTGWRVLEVRKGWARVAVGCDVFFLAVVGLASTSMIMSPAESAQASRDLYMSLATVVGFAVAMTFIGFSMYAHKKATKPRKPKRAWLPAFLRTSS